MTLFRWIGVLTVVFMPGCQPDPPSPTHDIVTRQQKKVDEIEKLRNDQMKELEPASTPAPDQAEPEQEP